MAVSMTDDERHQNLSQKEGSRVWNWRGENPIEVVLVAFILILFFTLPRTGCGIDKTEGKFSFGKSQQTAPDQPTGQPSKNR